jgi:hypothetical protein
MALLTAADREAYRLRREIAQQRQWLHDAVGDRRAIAFHKAKISELQAELDELDDRT